MAESKLNSWEKLGLAFLMIIMVISSASNVSSLRQSTKAAKNTDLIAQCTTPGTACNNLSILGEIRRTAENKCIIDALINLPPLADRVTKRAEILAQYDKCVNDEVISATPTTSK